MTTLTKLEARDAALFTASLALPDGEEPEVAARLAAAKAAGAEAAWLDELALMTVLFAGFPRALVVTRLVRRLVPVARGEDATDYGRWQEWRARGEATCRAVYGDHYEKLRPHVAELHPALDAWVIIDGYGRTLGRPALDMPRRELCAIAMLIPQRVPRQLHSHLRGALNVGASRAAIEAALDLASRDALVPKDRMATARRLWQDIVAKTGAHS